MNEETIFAEAIQIADAGRRAAFLDQACADNPSLRAGVDALLESHDQASCFLEIPAVESTNPTVVTDDVLVTDGKTQQSPAADLRFLKPSEADDVLGTLGHYEVLSEVGRGGLGVVLKVRDTRLDRIVAIKVPVSEYAAIAAVRQRFTREAKSAAAVRHDHLVTIHAVEEDRGIPYLVMECIDGISLQDAIDRDGPLEVKEVLRIGMQTARGLAAAHEQGLVHRDIKPANILLENGIQRVKITDFGLARAVDDVSMTQTGTVAGTPQYMSPEQAHAEQVDHRSDLFSLGSVLYAMCTGAAAFRANSTMAVLKRVCEEDPKPIRQINPEVPEWLCEIVEKLLEKRPEARFQSAGEVADLLNRHLAHLQQPESNPQPAPIRPTSRRTDVRTERHLKTVRYILAILGALSIGLFFLALVMPHHGPVGFGFGMPALLLSLIVAGTALNGAHHVAHRSSYRWALAGCIALMIPVSCLSLMSVPLAMVALGTLLRRDVKAVFGFERRPSADDDRTVVSESATGMPSGKSTLFAHCRRRYRESHHRWSDAAIVAALLILVAIAYVIRSGGVPNAWNSIAETVGIQYPRLSPWEDFRWDGEIAYAKIDGTWYEVVEIESIPTAELTVAADTMYADPKKWIVEDLAEVLGRIGRYGGEEAVTLSVRDLETEIYSGISVAMTRQKHQQLLEAIYGEFAPRSPSLAEGGSWPPMSAVAAPDDEFFTVTRDAELVRIRIRDSSIETSVVKDLGAPYTRIEGLALGQDGALYTTVGYELHRIDPDTGETELIGKMSHVHVNGLTFDADGDLLGVAKESGGAQLIGIDPDTARSRLVSGNIDEDLDSLVIDGSGRLLTTDGLGGTDEFYHLDPQSAEPATLVQRTPPAGYNRNIEGLTLGSDGYLYAVTNPDHDPPSYLVRIDPETLEYHNLGSLGFGALSIVAVPRRAEHLQTGQPIQMAEVGTFPGCTDAIRGIAWFADGSRVAATSMDGTLRVWDVVAGDELQSIEIGRSLAALAVSPDGRFAVVGSDPIGDGAIEIWNLETEQSEERLHSHTKRVTELCFSEDGRLLMSCGHDKQLRAWDFAEQRTIAQFTINNPDAVTISADGRFVAYRDPDPDADLLVHLGDIATGVSFRSFDTADVGKVLRTAFSSDGSRIAMGSVRGKVRIYQTGTGDVLLRLDLAHPGPILGLNFSPDNRLLITTGETDLKLRVWDAVTGDLLAETEAITHRFNRLATSPDGEHILSGGGWRWDVTSQTFQTDGDFDVHLYQIPDLHTH